MRLRIVAVASILGVASFVLNVALIGPNPVAAFYLPFTRAFELLVGAVLAAKWDRVSQEAAASDWRAWLGIALIAVASVILDRHRAFPGWWALLPVAGTALLLSAPFGLALSHRAGKPAAGPDRIDQLSALSSGTGRYWCFSPPSNSRH